jgi:hypothetical protein
VPVARACSADSTWTCLDTSVVWLLSTARQLHVEAFNKTRCKLLILMDNTLHWPDVCLAGLDVIVLCKWELELAIS